MKNKVISVILAAAMVSLAVAGCGKSTDSTNTNEKDASEKKDEKVVVYTAHPEEMLDQLSKEFEEKTGIEVECLNLGGDLAERVRSEKDNPQADVIYGQDMATYMALKDEGCLAPSNPSWADDLDDYYKDDEGYWYGTIKTPVMMFYNTEVMSEEEAPKDWKDLTDSKYADQIIFRGASASSSCTVISCWLDYFSSTENEEAGWNFIQGFDNNVKYYDDVKSLIMQAVGKGEAAIGVSTLNDIYDNILNNNLPLKEIYSKSGDVVLADCVAVTKDAKHPSAAAEFLEFVGSAEVQAEIANDYLRIPTLDAALADAPDWMSSNPIKALDVDWENIGEHKSDWTKTWVDNYMNAEIKANQ